MLDVLLPAPIVLVSADAEGLWDAAPAPEEAEDIAHAAPARQREFAAGRACARAGLARLGLDAGALRRGASRAPIWPEGVVGSITHCSDFCAAAVAPRAFARSVGLDAERQGRVTPRILARITTEGERAALAARPAGDAAPDRGTHVWTAKEAALKCLAVALGEMPGPREVEVVLSEQGDRFEARVRSTRFARAAPTLRGRHAQQGSLVVAATWWPADTPGTGAVP